jgi:hypothetical protein
MRLTGRDLEVVRTVLRLKFVSTRQLVRVFFGDRSSGQRRVRMLAECDFIRVHRKGLPPWTQYSVWRVTEAGVERVLREFPGEPVGDGLVERLSEASLAHLEHHEAVSEVYFKLITGCADAPAGASCAEGRARIAAMTGRASAIDWRPDGESVYTWTQGKQKVELVPDAVVTARGSGRRVFIELDRSQKALRRIEANLRRYGQFLAGPWPDHPPQRDVLYVVRSAGRKTGIEGVARKVFGEGATGWAVRTNGEAAAWLGAALGLGQPGDTTPAPPARSFTRDEMLGLYRFANGLVRRVRDRKLLDGLQAEDAAFFEEGRTLLEKTHRELVG